MASFETLSYDLIYYIFNCDYISFADLLQLSSVCQIFNCVANCNGLWRSRFKKRWPHSMDTFTSPSENWKILFKWRYYCECKVRQKLADLSADCYHAENIELDDVEDLYLVVHKDRHNFKFILDELDIFRTSNRKNCLPEKFYADRVWRFMKLSRLMALCTNYIEKPESYFLIEGAVLVSNWFEHYELPQFTKTSKALTKLVDLTVWRLQRVNPKHPVIAQYNYQKRHSKKHSIDREKKLSSERQGMLCKSIWGTDHCKEILESIHKIMFGYLDFQVDNTDSDCFSISKAIEGRGTKELLAIVFSQVAYRLGVTTQPVAITGNRIQFLKWKPNPDKSPEEVYYLDVEDDWTSKDAEYIFSHYDIPIKNVDSDLLELKYNPIEVFTLLMSEIVGFHFHSFFRHYTQLRVALSNLNIGLRCIASYEVSQVTDLYLIVFKNLATFLLNVCDVKPKTLVSRAQSRLPNETFPDRHKYRHTDETLGMQYAIGMIMTHRWEHYRCVIYSWDASQTEEWRKLFEIGRNNQPFYRVLLDNDVVAYVPEADLEIDDEKTPIRSIKVGKYFQSFHGNYYKPNKMAKSVYTDDSVARVRALQRHQNQNNIH